MNVVGLAINKDYKIFMYGILLIEILFLLLLVKSTTFGVLFWIIVCGSFFIYLYPEFGFAVPFTINILLYLLFDFVKVSIPLPAFFSYLILISAGTGIYLVKREEKEQYNFNNTLFWLSIAIGVILILGVPYSANKIYGIKKVFLYFTFNMPVFIVAILMRKDYKAIEKLLAFLVLIGLIIAIISNFSAQSNIFFKFVRFRLSDNVGPLYVGRTLGISSIAALFFIIRMRNYFVKIFFILSLFMLISPIFWSGSRAPVLGILMSFLFYYLLQPSQSLWRKISVTFFSIGVTILYFIQSGSQVAARLATPIGAEASAAFRVLAWIKAVQDFLGSPILGIGTGGFVLKTPYLPFVYPHNLILELASENGILGLLLITIFLFIATKIGFKNINYYFKNNQFRETQISIAVMSIFAFCLFNSMFSGDIYSNAIVWWPIGLIIALAPDVFLKKNKEGPRSI